MHTETLYINSRQEGTGIVNQKPQDKPRFQSGCPVTHGTEEDRKAGKSAQPAEDGLTNRIHRHLDSPMFRERVRFPHR